MKYALLQRLHGDVDLTTLRTYQDLFEGGATFRKRVTEYLPRHDVEPPAVYKRRCAQAHYLNYCASIVNYFASALFTCPPVLKSDPADVDVFWTDFTSDVDGVGTDLDAFLRALVVRALVGRRAYMRVEFPKPVATPSSLAEEDAAGLRRARLCPVPTENVRHWKRNDDGSFRWVMEYERREELEDFIDASARVTETWTQWRADGESRRWQLVRSATERVAADTVVPEIDAPYNPCGAIPLIELAMPAELWLLNHLADPALEHFRKRNALSWSIDRTCYAMPFFFLEDAKKPPTMGAGYFGLLGVKEKVEWPAPPSAPFEVIGNYARELVQEIHRVAQQMALGVDNNASAIGRSGESKAADNGATETVLKAYGKQMREPLERALDLIAQGRGEEKLVWSVGGMDVFDLADATTLTEMALASDPLQIPSPTYRRAIFKAVAHAQLPHVDDETRKAIDDEIDNGVNAEDTQQPPPRPPRTPGSRAPTSEELP